MKKLLSLALLLNALAFSPLSALAADKLPPLVMTSPDSAKATYADKCSNGGNIDKANRDLFVKNMLADSRSKLSQLKAQLLKEISDRGDEPRGDGVYVGDFVQSFHDRDGCGDSLNSFTAIVSTVVGGNTNHTVAQDLVTIDDDDHTGERTLSVRSIQKISIRDEQ